MSIKTTRTFPSNNLSVPVDSNIPQHRLQIHIVAESDISYAYISLYEKDGVYWYCLELVAKNCFSCTRQINSIAFVGLRNCVFSMKDTISSLGFSLNDPAGLRRFVSAFEAFERTFKDQKGVA